MISLRSSLAALFSFSLCAASGYAQSAGGPKSTAPLELVKLRAQFDANHDGSLDAAERSLARAALAKIPVAAAVQSGRLQPAQSQPIALEPVQTGERPDPLQVNSFTDRSWYDPTVVRTVFVEFSDADWEKQLSEFARTDVSLPALVTIDGATSAAEIRFRDPVATPQTGPGYKRSLVINFTGTPPVRGGEALSELDLLDAGTDPTRLRALLYAHVARQLTTAPQANLVRLVINRELWGSYVSTQPLDASFIRQAFGRSEGSWWYASAGANLGYLGANADAYRGVYRLQSAETPGAWNALIELCQLIAETPPKTLEATLSTRLDLDSALRFFALETALINQSGYGASRGGYGLYLAPDGRFRLIPQDAEASFRLIEVSEYGRANPRPDSGEGKKRPPDARATAASPDSARKPAAAPNSRSNFPKQAATDLAMMLSYSFVNKADSDFDGKITEEEWLGLARSWYLVMDEDLVGHLTRAQFLTKFRGLITPASIADGRTTQTFGADDAAAIIGQDFFQAMDRDHDDKLTSTEISATFADWFGAWKEGKPPRLTEKSLQRAFNTLFTKTIFQADQSYIAKTNAPIEELESEAGPGGKRRGGSGVGIGPLRLGGGGGGSRGGGEKTLITFSEQLDPLAAIDDDTRPLFRKLLAVPVLRTRYLEYVRQIAETNLTWAKLGPVAKQAHSLIAADVAKETHQSSNYIHFVQELDQDTTAGGRGGDEAPSLKHFIEERRSYLLKDDRVMGLEAP